MIYLSNRVYLIINDNNSQQSQENFVDSLLIVSIFIIIKLIEK